MSKKKKPTWQKVSKREKGVTYAGQDGLLYLYRYLKFTLDSSGPDRGRGPEMLKDVLVNRRVRCSNPKYFNDPWDCRPCIHPELLADPATRQMMAESLISTQRGGPKGDLTDYRVRNDPAYLRDRIADLGDYLTEFIPARWGMICLTKLPCSTLMWSHYADNHRGICLGFRVQDTLFRAAMKISYWVEYPKMVLGGNLVNHMLTIKSREWEKEAEYRLVCPLSSDVTESKESPLVMEDGFLPIEDSLHTVIMGCEIGEREQASIKILLREYAPDVQLQRAVRVQHSYLLTLQDDKYM